jgi:organic hydroperoxide reductase OsmC/OhrA
MLLMRQTFLALNVKDSQRFVAMSSHHTRVLWERGAAPFTYEGYVRDHRIFFGADEHTRLEASAAPAYRGNPALPNPEDELVASLSSCHMLSLLAIAAREGLTVERYEDRAEGTLATNAEGRLAMTLCVLRPSVRFSAPVSEAKLRALHAQAHRACFIAASVKTEVRVEPAAQMT